MSDRYCCSSWVVKCQNGHVSEIFKFGFYPIKQSIFPSALWASFQPYCNLVKPKGATGADYSSFFCWHSRLNMELPCDEHWHPARFGVLESGCGVRESLRDGQTVHRGGAVIEMGCHSESQQHNRVVLRIRCMWAHTRVCVCVRGRVDMSANSTKRLWQIIVPCRAGWWKDERKRRRLVYFVIFHSPLFVLLPIDSGRQTIGTVIAVVPHMPLCVSGCLIKSCSIYTPFGNRSMFPSTHTHIPAK